MAPSLANSVAQGAISGATGGVMTGNPAGIVAGAGIGILSGIIGYLIDSGHEEDAQKIMAHARAAYGGLDDSAIQKAAAEVLGPTKLAAIKTDPKYRAKEDEALSELGDISHGGLSLSDRANLSDAMDTAGQEANHERQAITSNFAARGMGGSGVELQSQLAAQQGGANRASANARRVAGDAQDRALKAIMEQGQLAGQIENTDYTRAATAATAQDSIDRFNNTAQYSRANDAYQRQLAGLDRQYGMAADQAGAERKAGSREASRIGGAIGGVGNLIQRGASQPGGDTYHTSETTQGGLAEPPTGSGGDDSALTNVGTENPAYAPDNNQVASSDDHHDWEWT